MREYDKLDARTIGSSSLLSELISGVLTKADSVGEGEYEPWLKILNGKSRQLHHEYYSTHLPSPKEMNQTWEEARLKERNFLCPNNHGVMSTETGLESKN